MQLDGLAAIVTGGASGLGFATARMLVEHGALVTILDLGESRVQDAAGQIRALGLTCDVADDEAAESALTKAKERHGPARVVINCAGIAPAQRVISRKGPMPLEDFERVIRVNLIGSFNLLRLGAADMVDLEPNEEGERGVVINTASIAAYEGQIGQIAYAASKAGVVGMTLPAARDLARHGIRVVSIAPGLIATPLLLNMPENVQDSLAKTVPFPSRFGKPEEYAALVKHIINNPLLNGETLRLDGALRMAPQ
ncbi:MAG: 3-hydroxyacyl-CoA dehydrogenase [Geminicoccaceae bacterium]